MLDDYLRRRITKSASCMLWLLVFFTAPARAMDPVIFHSDLDAGPTEAYITVWGRGFGAKPGTVTIGSAAVTGRDIQSWTDTKVEFRTPKNGGEGIKIRRSDGITSNSLPFTTRSGRVFYVSQATGSNANNGMADSPQGGGVGPWQDLSMVMPNMQAGDVVYVRNGVYTAILNRARGTNFYIQSANSGATGLPKALVAYPGEHPVIGDSVRSSSAVYFRDNVHDWTIAKLNLKAASFAINMSGGGMSGIRLIGNTAGGIRSTYGTVTIKGCTDCKILGNHVYDSGKPGNKLAHLIYYGGHGVGANVEIAWNLLHDEKGGRCIQVFGHKNNDRLSGLSIHDNTAYNCPYDGILVGSSDAAYKPWISDAEVYNNLVYNSGGGIRVNNTGVAAKVFHNTLYNNHISVKLEAAKSVEMHNNISSLPKRAHVTLMSVGSLSMSHNGYHGPPAIPSQDTKPTAGDPLFTDPVRGDFLLKTSSPFLNKGKPTGLHLREGARSTDPLPDLGILP